VYYFRVKGSLFGPYPDLATAKKNAAGHILSRSRDRSAEVVPFAPGAIGGVGPPVAIARKDRGGKVVWIDLPAAKE
jgi:hypothetical protein